MGDLEETIFQRNVPGRWSKYDGMFGSDRRAGDDDDVDNHDEGVGEGEANAGTSAASLSDGPHGSLVTDQHSHVPPELKARILAERDRKTQTGVKGVLADAKASKELDKAEAEAKRQQRAAVLRRMVEGHKVSMVEQQALSMAEMEAELAEILRQQELDGEGADDEDVDDDDFDDDDEGDDEFMRVFRERRLHELRAGTAMPTFDRCEDVDAERFVDCIETQDPRVTVCVHLFDPSVSTCVRLNRILDELAPLLPNIQFLRMSATAGGMELDRATLPILSLYRGGETHKVLAAIAHEIGSDFFSREDVQWLVEANL